MSMGNQKAGNYARAFNAAAAIVAAQDTGDADKKVIVGAVGELAEALFKQQNKFQSKNDITEESPKASTSSGKGSKRSSGRGSKSSGLTENQERAVKKAIRSIEDDDGESPYTIDELAELDPSGGKNSERSEAIGEIFELAYEG